jgi:hypothetical protein
VDGQEDGVLQMNLDTLLTPFLTWQFILSAVLINAVLIYVVRTVRVASPETLDKRWFKAILTLLNPALGLAIASVPGFLFGARYFERAFVGVCAGFLSHFIYALFIKRLAPTKDATNGVPKVAASEAVTRTEKPDPGKSK